jgi:hypothetical protein
MFSLSIIIKEALLHAFSTEEYSDIVHVWSVY